MLNCALPVVDGGTSTGDAVFGHVTMRDGKTPAANAQIIFVRTNAHPDSLPERVLQTDQYGDYRIVKDDQIAPGSYNIFATLNGQTAVEKQVQVNWKDPVSDEPQLDGVRQASGHILHPVIFQCWFKHTDLSNIASLAFLAD